MDNVENHEIPETINQTSTEEMPNESVENVELNEDFATNKMIQETEINFENLESLNNIDEDLEDQNQSLEALDTAWA